MTRGDPTAAELVRRNVYANANPRPFPLNPADLATDGATVEVID